MKDRTFTPTPSAPLGDTPAASPESPASGPDPRPTADALDTTDTPPVVQDEPGESADPAPANEEALADQAAEDVFGSEDNARNTAGLITSFVSS